MSKSEILRKSIVSKMSDVYYFLEKLDKPQGETGE